MAVAKLSFENDAFRIYTDPDDRRLKKPTTMARGTLPPIEIEIAPPRIDVARALPAEIENHMIAILAADRQGGETIDLTYKRKEHELATAFIGLTLVQARALHARLLAAREDDELASHFARLIEARRIRLLAFLLTARR